MKIMILLWLVLCTVALASQRTVVVEEFTATT
jgi:hypothetical protein